VDDHLAERLFGDDHMTRTALCIAVGAAMISLSTSFAAVAAIKPDARSNQLPLRFKDVNGKVLGRVAWGSGFSGTTFAVMQEGKQIFALWVFPTGADRTLLDFRGGFPVYYETTDCSGQAYLEASEEYILTGMRTAKAMFPQDGRTLIFVGSGTGSVIRAQSYQNEVYSCEVDRIDMNAAAVTATIDITGKYQAPFSIR
jgi:hypothetical protein